MRSFSGYHPAVLLLYFLSAAGITMFTYHPVFLGLSLLAALLLGWALGGGRKFFAGLVYSIPMFLLIAVVNPIFNHSGETILFYMNGNPVTMEAVLYGVAIAGMIFAVIYWFRSYSEIMTGEKFLYLFGKILPKLALVVCMTLRLIPRFQRQFRNIRNALRGMGMYPTSSVPERIRSALKTVSILISWALENAVETADSMRARGYGLKGRTTFSMFRFQTRDGVMIAVQLTLLGTVIAGMMLSGEFSYYPYLSPVAFDAVSCVAYAALALLLFVPFFIQGGERIRWRFLKSKI